MELQDLFTIDEVAKWCGISRNAAFMHYHRGHLKRCPEVVAHRVYFTRQEVEQFKAKYFPAYIWEKSRGVH